MDNKSGINVIDNTEDTQTKKIPLPSQSAWQEIKEIFQAIARNDDTSHAFLLRVVQPGLCRSDGWICLDASSNLCYRFRHP